MRTKPFRTVRRWAPSLATYCLIGLAVLIGTALGMCLAVWGMLVYFGVILL